MSTLPVFVGLDYHQKSVQVCVMDERGKILGNAGRANDWQDIRDYAASFGQVQKAAIEACCGAAHLAEELIAHAGWDLRQAHPGYVSRMKQNPDKSDYSDSRLLADLVRVGYLPQVWLAPQRLRELRDLVRLRAGLVNDQRKVKQQIRAVLRQYRVPKPEAKAWTKAWLKWLKATAPLSDNTRWVVDHHLVRLNQRLRQITVVEKRLKQVTAGDEVIQRLRKEKQIGPITAAVLRAEIGEFNRFQSGKQLSRFCGLSPRNASSGERQADAGLIKAGDAYLRSTLIQLAQRLMRTEPRWYAMGAAFKARGKPHNVAAAAVGNRFLRGLWHRMCGHPAPVPQAKEAA